MQGDEGATLVLVLAFLAVFGLVVSALLSQTDTSLKRTITTRSFDQKVYAADAGIDAGIQAVRNQDTLCANAGDTATLPPLTVNGKAVSVTCETISGQANGARGFAVITTSLSDDSLTTQSGQDKRIGGSVFASGLSNGLDRLIIQRGNLLENTATCNAGDSEPANLLWEAYSPIPPADPDSAPDTANPTPPWSYTCTSASWTTLDPKPALPSRLPLVHGALPDKVIGSCSIFRPGTYSSGIVLGQRNYFTSGIYYFTSGVIGGNGKEIVAGAPAAGESAITTSVAPCTANGDAELEAAQTGKETIQGTGATIILGGTSRIEAGSNTAIEIYTRTGGAAWENAQSVSARSVSTGTAAPWTPSTPGYSPPVIGTDSGSNHSLVMHGLLYAPDRFVDFFATNDVKAQLVGGVVAGKLQLQSSASAAGLAVSTTGGIGVRRIKLTSTATESGSRPIVSTAVLDITGDEVRTSSLLSWTTQPN